MAEVLNAETQALLVEEASALPPTNWWLGASDEETVSILLNTSKILKLGCLKSRVTYLSMFVDFKNLLKIVPVC